MTFDFNQYDESTSKFFEDFNLCTGRDTLYWGFIEGYISNRNLVSNSENIAVDIGCGTGWLVSNLATKFHKVYGIDKSEWMLKRAKIKNNGDNIEYSTKAPSEILGKCDFVSAVHVHYHFETKEDLKAELFQIVADILKPDGLFIMIGCPSDNLREAPDHYKNHIKIDELPHEMLEQLGDTNNMLDVPVSAIPKYYNDGVTPFNLKDGIKMKVILEMACKFGEKKTQNIIDTYWSDETLIYTAKKCGLELVGQSHKLTWRGHPNAYMALCFRKIESSKFVD